MSPVTPDFQQIDTIYYWFSEIVGTLAIIGMIATVVIFVDVFRKALRRARRLEQERRDRGDDYW